jgi:hypothetical protein
MDQINKSGDWNDDIQASFEAALKKFSSTQTW